MNQICLYVERSGSQRMVIFVGQVVSPAYLGVKYVVREKREKSLAAEQERQEENILSLLEVQI